MCPKMNKTKMAMLIS